MFHELGHGIHDLVSRTTYSRFHGTNVVEDFAEVPSQMLEHWCWTHSQLRSLSHHYSYLSPEYEAVYRDSTGNKKAEKPPKEMPNCLITSIINTKHVNGASSILRQLRIGIFDMMIHGPASQREIQSLDISRTYNKLLKEICQMDGPEALEENDFAWGNGQATSQHLVFGYDAG